MRKKILLVDDEQDILAVYKKRLSDRGFDVDCVTDGNAAIETAIKTHPDLILLDVVMPALSGLEVAKTLQDHPETRDIPILYWTFLKRPNDHDFTIPFVESSDLVLAKDAALDDIIDKINLILALEP